MKRKWMKAAALMLALAMLMGLALAEQPLETMDEGEETPAELGELELVVEEGETVREATYRFIVDDSEYDCQVARVGEEILRPEDPAAPAGKVFAGWMLADGAPMFVDADEDGQIDPVIVGEEELGAEICAWAAFADVEELVESDPEEENAPAEQADETASPDDGKTEDAGEGDSTSPVSPDGEPASPQGEASEDAQEPSADGEATEEPQKPSADGEATEDAQEPSTDGEATEAQKPSPYGESGSAEALTDEVPSPEAADEVPSPDAADALAVLPVANELTYTGEAQPLVSAEGEWLYSLDGETYSAEIPTAIDAGEYTVFFKAAEADEPQTLTVTVAKADVVFTAPVAAVSD